MNFNSIGLRFIMKKQRYNSYSGYLKTLFSERVQKIAIDAGFTCPNRDGTKGQSGCIYCDNKTFNPFYCTPSKPVTQQLDEGIAFFSAKYKTQQYLAYFQAYTNTYAPVDKLRSLYDEALAHPAVTGLVISTRPDCISDEILDLIAGYAMKHYVVVEYGIESCHDETLLLINRCHSWDDAIQAIERSAKRGILTGAHLILGLPGETREMILENAKRISSLPVDVVKLHQMQVIKGTELASAYEDNPGLIINLSLNDYISLVIGFIELLRPGIMIERFCSESPKNMIIYPDWGGKKNFEVTHMIDKRMEESDTWQGKFNDQVP